MSLGSMGRFYVVALGGLVVIVTIVIVACFVGPGCWGFEFLMRREKNRRKKDGEGDKRLAKDPEKALNSLACDTNRDYWLTNHDYVIYQAWPCHFDEKRSKLDEPPMHHHPTGMGTLKFSLAPLLTCPSLGPGHATRQPRLRVKLVYAGLKSNDLVGRLTVHVVSASSLPSREYMSTLDPYVSLDISNNRWPFVRSARTVHTVQTRVVRDNLNPEFDQAFTFDGSKREIRNWCLKFTIGDNDRLTRPRSLFEKRVYLKDLKKLTVEGSISLNLDMEKTARNVGTVLFGIRYLPTSKRFNVDVIRAEKLKYQSYVSSLVEFCPYVRVIMLNGRGKCLKKRKTCIRQGEFSPTFNQSFIFDLSISNLEETVFLVLLCTKMMNQLSGGDDSSLDGDGDGTLRDAGDRVLGMTVLGRNVDCSKARNHWVSVMQNPRKMISVWHDLR